MTKKAKQRLGILLKSAGDMALRRRARKIVEGLDPQNGDHILDIGCGDGYYLYLLSNLGLKLKLEGVDIDPKALKSAKKNLDKSIKLHQGDLMKKLPFKHNQFDKVVMSEVIEHLPDDLKGLLEARRVVRENGTLIVTVPCRNFPFFWDPLNWVLQNCFGAHVRSGVWAGLWNQHLRLYTVGRLKKLAKDAGFKNVSAEAYTWWSLPFNHNLMFLAARSLYGGNMGEEIAKAVNKYVEAPKRPLKIALAFFVVETIDKLNDLWKPENRGVGIFLRGSK